VIMTSIDYNALKQLERELVFVLKEEYSFYQSLYIKLDQQRDAVKYNKDEDLLDLFAEIERYYTRINNSDEKIKALKERNPELFRMALALPEVKKIVSSMTALVKKNLTLVQESEQYLKEKYERIRSELGELQNSQKILQYITAAQQPPLFIDGKK